MSSFRDLVLIQLLGHVLCVNTQVEEMRVRDVALGVPAAKILEGFVRRKVIKQTVMTTVYGVTKFGARLQIAKQLKGLSICY